MAIHKSFSAMNEIERKEYLEEHFLYEINMLYSSLQQFVVIPENADHGLLMCKQMAAECFLLHAKILFEFFYDFKKLPTTAYMSAWHFYDDLEEFKKVIPIKTEHLIKLNKRINNEVSHMGAARINGNSPEKTWPLDLVYNDFVNVIRIFVFNLPEKYSSNNLLKYLEGLK